MLLQDSRRAARVGRDGEIVLLEEQDRSFWDRTRIDEGIRVLERAVSLRRPGPYQLQAAIAAAHAEDRPKSEIVTLYDALAALDPSPVVRLNHAVAVALAGDVDGGLELLNRIDGLDGYHLLHAARADLFRRLERGDEAADVLPARARTDDERGGEPLPRAAPSRGLVGRARPPRRRSRPAEHPRPRERPRARRRSGRA